MGKISNYSAVDNVKDTDQFVLVQDGETRKAFASQIIRSEKMVYGVRWDSVNDTMEAGVVVDGQFQATDYQNYPIQENIGRYLLTTAGAQQKLDKHDSSTDTDGNSVSLDGSAGQVMAWVPRFHMQMRRIGDYFYCLISKASFIFEGVSSWVHPTFLNYSGFWVGAFQGVAASDSNTADVHSVVKDTSGYSMSYPNPFTNQTRGEFRTQCANVGSGFCQWSYGMQEVIRILFLAEYKTWNSQEALPGHTERSSFNYGECSKAGETVNLGDYSGSIYDDGVGLYIANSYRGIENPFGNVWQWVDGINIDTDDNQRVWLAFDPDNFTDDATTNYTDSGIAPGFDDTSDYQKNIDGTGKYAPLWPVTLNDGADSSSYITDYFWSLALGSGWRVVRSGGLSHNSGLAGLGCLLSNNDSGASSDDVGSRLAAYK